MTYCKMSEEERPNFDEFLQVYGQFWNSLSEEERDQWKEIADTARQAGYRRFNTYNWQMMLVVVKHFQG